MATQSLGTDSTRGHGHQAHLTRGTEATRGDCRWGCHGEEPTPASARADRRPRLVSATATSRLGNLSPLVGGARWL